MSYTSTNLRASNRNLPQADPYFDSVVLLAPLSGEDGDTTSTDLSDSAHTSFTWNGTSALDGDIRRYGFTSLQLDGDSDYVEVPHSADWAFGTGDFTIECDVRFNALPNTDGSGMCMLAHYLNTGNDRSWFFNFETNDELQFWWSVDGTNTQTLESTTTPTLSTNTWYHVAACRDGNNIRIFFDGAEIGSSTDITGDDLHDSARPLDIGRLNSAGFSSRFFNGWIENVRITKGVARYTAAFTPPERAYPKRRTSAPVKDGLILHLDPANSECFGSGETTATNLITGGSLTGASGTPGTGAHTPAPANFPAYSSLNGGIFDFAGGRGMNVEEDLGSYTAMSLEIWYYKDSGATTQYLADARNDGGQWFLTNYTSFNITWQSSATYNFDTTYDGVNTDFINRWQHLIMTSDATGSKLYIDGTERTLLTSNSLSETFGVNYRIGTRYTTSGEWTGYMGPIRLYNRVLSLSEVKQNFNAQKSRFDGF